ncbi:hypothetical protein PAPYR_11454 [Paratrimastix pyriformis]|uniref:Uncharacterized protein n=1 Tax=Paratrimastix pyriformis TaxID=342808 RepID=A0ABQ8U9D2_9EUKA|nr:hypothetical protein PAPYR_11454 [Paratrimastix pyriformis]
MEGYEHSTIRFNGATASGFIKSSFDRQYRAITRTLISTNDATGKKAYLLEITTSSAEDYRNKSVLRTVGVDDHKHYLGRADGVMKERFAMRVLEVATGALTTDTVSGLIEIDGTPDEQIAAGFVYP